MKNKKIHFYLFGILLFSLVILRLCQNKESWHVSLLFLFPITLCFLIWSLKEHESKSKFFVAIFSSILCWLFWYDFANLNIYVLAPVLSAGLALLIGGYVDEKDKKHK